MNILKAVEEVLDDHERQEPGCLCGWAYDDSARTYDEHLAAHVAEQVRAHLLSDQVIEAAAIHAWGIDNTYSNEKTRAILTAATNHTGDKP